MTTPNNPHSIGLSVRRGPDAGVSFGMRAAPKEMPPLILASGSPRRTELLRQLGLEFTVVPSDAPELHPEQLTAREAAQINAYRKARSVAKKNVDALVIGADTLVYLDSRLYGKPGSLEEAYGMLEELQGKTHQVVTAVCLLCLRRHSQRLFADSTSVTFRPLDAVAIRRYLSRVNPLDKAGAYAIQEERELIIERIEGSYTNVVGLPTECLAAELANWAAGEPPSGTLPFISAIAEQPPPITRHLRI